MSLVSQHKLNILFEKYRDREIAFTKSMMHLTRLDPANIYVKVKSTVIHCIIYSCSMKSVKVIVNLSQDDFAQIQTAKNLVNIRFSFKPKASAKRQDPIVFFIPSLVKGFNKFEINKKNAFLISADFVQKPPDDLIEILGRTIEVAENFEKRKNIRIPINDTIIKEIGFVSGKVVSIIDNIKRPSIIKNISSGGCLIILSCVPKFLVGKDISIQLVHKDSMSIVVLYGKVLRFESIENRTDIFGLGISFYEDKIPFVYKELLSDYLDTLERKLASQKNRDQS